MRHTRRWDIYYICRDYLGSITHITNSSGSVVQELSYDAWGQLRNPTNQTVYAPDAAPELFLGRGYTGHEHLPMFGLVNMNARLYDPALGRFLSPDPFVQSPDFIQNFNRYSYCLNNPLRYTDPNGEWFGFDDLIAAATGFVVGYVGHGISTGNWGWSAVAAGGMGAGMAWLGYNTMGGSAVMSGWQFSGNQIVNSALSFFTPSYNFSLGGVNISLSPVSMFSMGAMGTDFRFGVGLTASYKIGNWTLSAGTDFLRAGGRTGFGMLYGGGSYDDGKNGFSFYATRYMYGAKQASGILGLRSGDYRINFEDDIFGFLSGGGVHDRNRTSALEFCYKDYYIGTQVITNDPKGEGYTPKNKKWEYGYQLASALYVGYKNKNSVVRAGINSALGGYLGQNWWHKNVFHNAEYQYGWDHDSPFYQVGTNQFYTLY